MGMGQVAMTTHLKTSNVSAWSPVVVNLHQRDKRREKKESVRQKDQKLRSIYPSFPSEVLTKCFTLHQTQHSLET